MLTEFEVTAAPKADPKQAKPVELAERRWPTSARTSFDVAKAIDGNDQPAASGWAVSPATA